MVGKNGKRIRYKNSRYVKREGEWLSELTDRNNLWFQAMDVEDDGMYSEAYEIYLKDYNKLLAEGFTLRAALSCSCAAYCLVKSGGAKKAPKFFFRAAHIYETHADKVMSNSIRESIWALKEAHANYELAQSAQNASRVYDKIFSLTKKVNSFHNGVLPELRVKPRNG